MMIYPSPSINKACEISPSIRLESRICCARTSPLMRIKLGDTPLKTYTPFALSLQISPQQNAKDK